MIDNSSIRFVASSLETRDLWIEKINELSENAKDIDEKGKHNELFS